MSSASCEALRMADLKIRFSVPVISFGATQAFSRARRTARAASSRDEITEASSPEMPGGTGSAAAGAGGEKYFRGSRTIFRASISGTDKASDAAASTSATVRFSWRAERKSGICMPEGMRLR